MSVDLSVHHIDLNSGLIISIQLCFHYYFYAMVGRCTVYSPVILCQETVGMQCFAVDISSCTGLH